MIFDKGAKIIKIIDAEEDDNEDSGTRNERKERKAQARMEKEFKNTKKWSTKLRISTSRNCLQE